MTDAYVEKNITAENTFSDPLYVAHKANVIVSGTVSGSTITVQKAFAVTELLSPYLSSDSGATATWVDVEEYTGVTSQLLEEGEEGVFYRIGIKTGDYGSGTTYVRIGR